MILLQSYWIFLQLYISAGHQIIVLNLKLLNVSGISITVLKCRPNTKLQGSLNNKKTVVNEYISNKIMNGVRGGSGGGRHNIVVVPSQGENRLKERDEDLLLFRELHKKDRVVSLLQPVSDEFEPTGICVQPCDLGHK